MSTSALPPVDANFSLRRSVYRLVTVVTVAACAARILSAEAVVEPSLHRNPGDTSPNAPSREWSPTRPTPVPTFSSNDRSRWAAVRALVDEGTFVIGKREVATDGKFTDSGIIFEDGWKSLDKVLDPETRLYYSSKPPLFTVLVAGEYWVLKKLLGWTFPDDLWKIVRTTLLTFNVIGLLIYLHLLAGLIERYGRTDWGKIFTFLSACAATYITSFAITLNNHTVAAVAALGAIYPLLMDEWLSPRSLAISGLCAGLAACFELPALAFLAALFAWMLLRQPARTLLVFLPMALIPLGAQTALNYATLRDWKPAYEKLDTVWYRYEGSHWNKQGAERKGIDFAADKESRGVYAFHLLVGHHGVFSLTPIWLLAFGGMIGSAVRSERGPTWRQAMAVFLLVSIVVIGYFAVWVSTANYGGWTSGPRWLFWLTPLWLLGLLAAVDRMALAGWTRCLAGLCLAVSAFSVAFMPWNPWRHPWIFQWLENLGWIRY